MSELKQGLNIRYRPRLFIDVIGHNKIKDILESTILSGNIPQQILFSGGSGLGKTTLGRIYASAILCLKPRENRINAEPCGICPSCEMVATNSHPDLIEFDAASNGGKEEIKDIALRAQLVPLVSDRKVYIIDEAHGLSGAGGQAFLKLLEEPPRHIVFILCTTDPEKMLNTNRSRCVEFKLSQPTIDEKILFLEKILEKEGLNINKKDLEVLINNSDPILGVRGVVSNLSKYINIFKVNPDVKITDVLEIPDEAVLVKLHNSYLENNFPDTIKILDDLSQNISPQILRRNIILYLKNNLSKDNSLLIDILGCENSLEDITYSYLSNMKKNSVEKIVSDFVIFDQGVEKEFWEKIGNNFILTTLLKESEVTFGEKYIEVKADRDLGEKIFQFLPEIKKIITELGYEPKFGKI